MIPLKWPFKMKFRGKTNSFKIDPFDLKFKEYNCNPI